MLACNIKNASLYRFDSDIISYVSSKVDELPIDNVRILHDFVGGMCLTTPKL